MPASSTDDTVALVAFRVGATRWAVDLTVTERVEPMVAITPLPGAPEVLLGAINVHGDAVPVVDLGRRAGYRRDWRDPAAALLLVRVPRRVAIAVDEVLGAIQVDAGAVRSRDDVLPGVTQLAGVVPDAHGLLLVHDLDELLSADEERDLALAIGRERK